MLLGVLGGNLVSPSHWHKSFIVGRGLDLSSGTSITLKAVTAKQPGQTTAAQPSAAAMAKAVQIITNRVEASGLSGATVLGPDRGFGAWSGRAEGRHTRWRDSAAADAPGPARSAQLLLVDHSHAQPERVAEREPVRERLAVRER